MATERRSRRDRLSIEVEPELRRSIEEAAAERGQSIREYVVDALRRALAADDLDDRAETAQWAQLAARSFARDWDSAEDEVYDQHLLTARAGKDRHVPDGDR